MKIKRFTKLALAGVGLAATAATLTTSTYAWYVTNSKVEATGVQGAVDSEGAGSLYIAENNYDTTLGDHHAENYTTKLQLEKAEGADQTAIDTAVNNGAYLASNLLPQTKATGTLVGCFNLAKLDAAAGVNATEAQRYAAAETAYNSTLKAQKFYTTTTFTEANLATGVYDSDTVLYINNQSHDKTGYDALSADTPEELAELQAAYKEAHPYWDVADGAVQVNGADDLPHQILPAEYNNDLKSTRYHVAKESNSAYATGLYNASSLYFDEEDVINEGDWVDANGYKVEDTSINFKFWLKSGEDTDVTQILKLDNVSDKGIPGQILTTTTGTTEHEVNDAVIADAAKALRMSVSIAGDLTPVVNATTFNGTGANDEEIAAANEVIYDKLVAQGVLYKDVHTEGTDPVWNLAKNESDSDYDSDAVYAIRLFTTKTYQLVDVAKNKTGLAAYDSDTTTAVTENTIDFADGLLDANKYYFALMGDKPTNTGSLGASDDFSTTDFATSEAEGTAFATIELDSNVDTLVVYKIWLEGSDGECWDSCKGQEFTFDFEFRAK